MHINPNKDARVSGVAEDRPAPERRRRAAADDMILKVWKPANATVALGLAVQYLRQKPVFARFPFGGLSQVLIGQIKHGRFHFIVDQKGKVQGFVGWALTLEPLAEEWANGRANLRVEDCGDGDIVIVNVWAAESYTTHRFMFDVLRQVLEGKRRLYFMRHYPDGHSRMVRLAVTDSVSGHVTRAAAKRRRSSLKAVE